MENSNRSAKPGLHDLGSPLRRRVLQGGTAALAALLAGCASNPSAGGSRLGFTAIPPDTSRDGLKVPPGYVATVIAPWGDPVGIAGAMPAWKADASNSAAEQALQFGMHHDGLHFYALDRDGRRGLLVMNHEYTDDGLLHTDGFADWSAEKVRKAQAANGISVCEVVLQGREWRVVRPSKFARRITAQTPVALSGPAAGHVLMRTAADPDGRTVLGTLANCAAGKTPWGTYLSGEENWADYFAGGDYLSGDQKRWGLPKEAWYRWPEHDRRFDARRHPNEFHRFGWVVEVDPLDPLSTPVKRTALGRAAHEGATVTLTKDGRAVVYAGEDARFEYIYKFVSRDRMQPGGAKPNATLLDNGTLYVARFDADGSGRWLPLVHGQGPLLPANGFADPAEVLIKARQASDALGATPMDRPEWITIAASGEVYCTLTYNEKRGQPGQPGVDAANPRANNTMGQIIRWQEAGDADATAFSWNLLLLAGDPANERAQARGNIRGDAFACPDGIAFDSRGVLWIQCDVASSDLNRGEMVRLGNNQMLACDPATGEVRRFLTGPAGCEITGLTWAPDGRSMFLNIQHPGEPPGERNDPANPGAVSSWPGAAGGRPRSATVVVRKSDGGIIGT
jgi:secreted PhoX family phosphatase